MAGCVAGVVIWFALAIVTGFSDTRLAAGSAALSVVIIVLVAVLENAQLEVTRAVQ